MTSSPTGDMDAFTVRSQQRTAEAAAYHAAEIVPFNGVATDDCPRPGTTTDVLTWSNATHICTSEVEIDTGLVTILRYIVSEDCGTMINPKVVEGQVAGGVVQGIGGTLLEHFVYDGDGNPLTTTFLDYLVPTASQPLSPLAIREALDSQASAW